MVSGGFWLSADRSMCLHQRLDTGTVTFSCDDQTRPASAFKHVKVRQQQQALCVSCDHVLVALMGCVLMGCGFVF